MFAQMRHMAIVTSNAHQEGDFYQDVFGMKRSSLKRAGGAVVVGDGYVGLNLNPRAPGRQAGFDHFGFEVQDTEVVFARLKEKYPKIQVLHRPSNRPFAGISMHDPMGNVFDLSQAEHGKPPRSLHREGRGSQAAHRPLRPALRRAGDMRRILSRRFRIDRAGKTRRRSESLSIRRQSHLGGDALEDFRLLRLRHRAARPWTTSASKSKA